jgi:ketosteroid isomerase-like protein
MDEDAMLALAKRFFDAVEAGDVATVGEIYAPDAVIWHNTDGVAQSREDNLRTLDGLARFLVERRYAERRVGAFAGGFVHQHVLEGVRRDGARVALEACIVCQVKDGRITRLDEYFDSAAVAAFVGAPLSSP